MPIDISARFAFTLDQPGDVLLQFEAAHIPEQPVLRANTQLPQGMHFARVFAQNDIGERIWMHGEGDFEIGYKASVDVRRQVGDVAQLARLDTHDLPGEAVEYLFDSIYCPASRLQSFAIERFGELEGGAKIAAMVSWISENFTYEPGSSGPNTTALDSFVERRGICRDYAHVLVALARAAAIPARYVSCYAPGVDPPDFHAVAEVFLADPQTPGGGSWQIVDATNMADPAQTVKIGVGRDAADVSFLTSFCHAHFRDHEVNVTVS